MSLVKRGFLVILVIIQINSFSQGFRLDDPNLIFKDKNGKVLPVDSVRKIAARGPFSTQQNPLGDGKSEVIIVPMSSLDLKNAVSRRTNAEVSWTGKAFPNFELTTLKGKTLKRTDIEGKVTVINFWFIGCQPCLQEIPKLNGVVSSLNNYKNSLQFIAPSLDGKEALIKFSAKRTFDYTILSDANLLAQQMQINSFPTHMILDRKGIVRQMITGASDDIGDKLKSAIKGVLEEK